jgi:mannose-6-phosphate isomerase-like protein (cupin superfamily)
VKARVVRPEAGDEFETRERCRMLESWNDESDPAVSIARARVAPGVTTELHALDVNERYVILSGRGRAEIGDLEPADVGPGDIVVIPAGATQRIANTGPEELVFYCVCTPRFVPEAYRALE